MLTAYTLVIAVSGVTSAELLTAVAGCGTPSAGRWSTRSRTGSVKNCPTRMRQRTITPLNGALIGRMDGAADAIVQDGTHVNELSGSVTNGLPIVTSARAAGAAASASSAAATTTDTLIGSTLTEAVRSSQPCSNLRRSPSSR